MPSDWLEELKDLTRRMEHGLPLDEEEAHIASLGSPGLVALHASIRTLRRTHPLPYELERRPNLTLIQGGHSPLGDSGGDRVA